jgi:hypothetical protein
MTFAENTGFIVGRHPAPKQCLLPASPLTSYWIQQARRRVHLDVDRLLSGVEIHLRLVEGNITPAWKFLTRTHLAPRDGGHLAERDEYILSRRGNTVEQKD